jgi:hypothetical protein
LFTGIFESSLDETEEQDAEMEENYDDKREEESDMVRTLVLI